MTLKQRQEYQEWIMTVCDVCQAVGDEAPVYIRPPWYRRPWYAKLYTKVRIGIIDATFEFKVSVYFE